MKIAIIGEVYANNIGDGIICRCSAAILSAYLPKDCEILLIDLSGRNQKAGAPAKHGFFSKFFLFCRGKVLSNRFVKKLLSVWIPSEVYGFWQFRFRERRSIKRICESNPVDAVVFAGGEIFKDYFVYKIQAFTKYYRVPTYFYACGVDSQNHAFITKKFKKIISQDHIKMVTTRSQKDTCKALIRPEKYIFLPDAAIMAGDVFPRLNPPTGSRGIGLGIMCIDEIEKKREPLLNFWKSIIDLLIAQGKTFYLFVNGAAEDYHFAKEVLAFTKLPKECLLPCPASPEELIEQITSFDRICAFRMHSAIVAYAYGIPFVGFGWDKKVYDFANMIEREELIYNWETAEPKEILQTLQYCTFDDAVLERLKSQVREGFKKVADQICMNT